ncbi:prefoldin subunit [Candidatus Woesearchaeota archaeon]|nr:prefoldin subunit [Candidatus Woesearchaeota archaeon]
MNKQVQEKVSKLQLLEQNVAQLVQQKQQFQSAFFELESALKELQGSSKSFRIIGNIMVSADKEVLKKDVLSRKEILELKIGSLEKQEGRMREDAKVLQEEIVGEMKNE